MARLYASTVALVAVAAAAATAASAESLVCEDNPEFKWDGYTCAEWGSRKYGEWSSDCFDAAYVAQWYPDDPDAFDTMKENCPLSCDEKCGGGLQEPPPACKKVGKKEVCDNDVVIAELLGPGTRCPDAASLCKHRKHGPIVSFVCPISCGGKKIKKKALKGHDTTVDHDDLAGMIKGYTSCMDVPALTCTYDKAAQYMCPEWCSMTEKCQGNKIAAYKKSTRKCKGKKSESKGCTKALEKARRKWKKVGKYC